MGEAEIKDESISIVDLSDMGAAAGQILKYSGTKWIPAKDETGGLVLPFASNYGGANPVAFSINSINNTTPIEVSQGALVSTVPAFRATSLGEKGIEVEGSSNTPTNVTARIFNKNQQNIGTILQLENEGEGLALNARSSLGSAAKIEGNVNKLGSVLEVSNLGIGKVIQVTNGNPATVENTMEIRSATNSSILKLESTRNANQSAATALELKKWIFKSRPI
ncbi:MAG: hypothetical protein IPL98_05280 [Saprospiraceae bacterium]|nr:hypothetical protein [Saprospiraceae bacterium]